jgi:uncharacterized protein
MSEPQHKLDRGSSLLNSAGDDPDLLGLALQSIHGALKDHFQHLLLHNPIIPIGQKEQVNRADLNWRDLLDLMQQYEGINDGDRMYILRMNQLRNTTAHGEPFAGSQSQVKQYLEFVRACLSSEQATDHDYESSPSWRSSKAKNSPYSSQESAQGINFSDRQWTALVHFSLLTSFIIPFSGLILSLVIWQVKRQEVPQLDTHAINIANWLISVVIYGFVCGALSVVLIGIPLMACLIGCVVIFPIVAGIKANNGKVWRYPLAICFLK